ncbi:Uncharacterized protein FWK35_00032125, partial [Aphis craccivora]
MQELCLISIKVSRVNAKFGFLNNLINSRLDAPAFLLSINIKVFSRITRHHAPFVVPVYISNYEENGLLHHMMRLANESTVYQD